MLASGLYALGIYSIKKSYSTYKPELKYIEGSLLMFWLRKKKDLANTKFTRSYFPV